MDAQGILFGFIFVTREYLGMINFGFKTKAGTKPKKARETSIKACCCSGGKDALTPEDIAEINMLSKAIAKMNVARR